MKYETKHFEIDYSDYGGNRMIHPLSEIYLTTLYDEFKHIFTDLVLKNDIFQVQNENKLSFIKDILSYLVINNHTKDNPFFTYDPNYSIKTLKSLLFTEKINRSQLKRFRMILREMEKHCKIMYKRFSKEKGKIEKIDYTLDFVSTNSSNQSGNKVLVLQSPLYQKSIILKKSIYIHLVKAYNLNHYEDFESVEPLNAKDFHHKVFYLYLRYFALDSGNNQSSILPSFKQVLKKFLNIKIELFGSALNTSYKYASLFYDVEKPFGSLGDFFKLNVHKGYYEVNPPYENNLINDVFKKLSVWLSNAQKNENPLLFFMILPKRNYSNFSNFKFIQPFLKKYESIPKDIFPFMRFNRLFSKIVISPIVEVNIIILHNDFIENIYKSFVESWDTIFRFKLS